MTDSVAHELARAHAAVREAGGIAMRHFRRPHES